MKRFRGITFSLISFAFVWQLYAAPRADVKQVSESRVQFKGTLGAVMRFMGANKPIRTATYLKGNVLRTDHFDKKGKLTNSQIIDLDKGLILQIDHKKKKYTQMTLEEWKEMIQASMEAFGQPAEETEPEEEQKTRVEWDFQVDVQKPGDHRKIAGYEAEKAILTITVTGRTMEEQESGEMEETGRGGLKVISTIWLGKSVAGMEEMKAFRQRLAEELGFQPGEGGMKRMLKAIAESHPAIVAALERVKKETEKLEGVPLETHTVYASWGETKKQESMEEEEEVPKSVGGLLKGFGRKLRKKKKKDKNKPNVLMETRNRTVELKTKSLPADLFAAPQGYKLITKE